VCVCLCVFCVSVRLCLCVSVSVSPGVCACVVGGWVCGWMGGRVGLGVWVCGVCGCVGWWFAQPGPQHTSNAIEQVGGQLARQRQSALAQRVLTRYERRPAQS
jgi:hypothetical protein